MQAFTRPFTVWRLKSVDGKQEATVAYHTEPREYESEYCRVIARMDAYSKGDALKRMASVS